MIGKTLSIIGKILMWIGGIVFVIGLVRLNPFDIGPGFVLFVIGAILNKFFNKRFVSKKKKRKTRTKIK